MSFNFFHLPSRFYLLLGIFCTQCSIAGEHLNTFKYFSTFPTRKNFSFKFLSVVRQAKVGFIKLGQKWLSCWKFSQVFKYQVCMKRDIV